MSRRLLFILLMLIVVIPVFAQDESPPALQPPAVLLSDTTVAHIRALFQLGQSRGNRPHVFSKIGDSITASYSFLYYIGVGEVTLGSYTHLQPVIDAFTRTNARVGNSFVNESLAARAGWTAYGALNPDNLNSEVCTENELPLTCEYRLVRPSMALIMFGTNDVSYVDPETYRYNMSRIIDLSENMGVIPILSTIPVRVGFESGVETLNAIIRDLAASRSIPLWDYAIAMRDLPNFGLSQDNVHPSSPPRDVATVTNFSPPFLQYGYNVRNVTALEMLYSVWWYLQPTNPQ